MHKCLAIRSNPGRRRLLPFLRPVILHGHVERRRCGRRGLLAVHHDGDDHHHEDDDDGRHGRDNNGHLPLVGVVVIRRRRGR